MAEEKKLPLPEKELPPPHDMLLNPESKNAGQSGSGSKPPGNIGFSGKWEKYGSKKWLLPLLAFIGILILIVGISAVMDMQDGSRSRADKRQDRREKKRDRKEEKRDRKQNKNQNNKNQKKKAQKNKNKAGKNAKANADAGWIEFNYGTGNQAFSMKYPSDMTLQDIASDLGGIYGQTRVDVITLNNNTQTMTMSTIPNPNNLSLTEWHDLLATQQNEYSVPTESITVSRSQALLQNVNGTWNAYLPMNDSYILWTTMTDDRNNNAAKRDFVTILQTIRFGQSLNTLPSLPVNPTGL